MISDRTADRGMWAATPAVAGLVLLLMWVMGVAAMRQSPDAWTAIGLALVIATSPAVDLAIGAWRGTITREEIERTCYALAGPWMGLFMALGLLFLR